MGSRTILICSALSTEDAKSETQKHGWKCQSAFPPTLSRSHQLFSIIDSYGGNRIVRRLFITALISSFAHACAIFSSLQHLDLPHLYAYVLFQTTCACNCNFLGTF
eukprot:m.144247 g.144247  ORF g.144247 m.144247 type:complete len:106 (-) comp14117_c1_seq3:487-804(-)